MALTFLLLIATVLVAVVDWWAVASDRRRVEYVAKPSTLLLLLGVAVLLEPADAAQRVWFVGALVASLIGDMALLLPVHGDTPNPGRAGAPATASPPATFIVGLLAFLVGHLGYIGGFVVAGGLRWVGLAAGAAVVAAVAVTVGARILGASEEAGDRGLTVALAAYLGVIGVMVVIAYGTLEVLAITGATLFLVSDAILGWTRFVRPARHGRVAIMVTYHLGQIGLVLSLLT